MAKFFADVGDDGSGNGSSGSPWKDPSLHLAELGPDVDFIFRTAVDGVIPVSQTMQMTKSGTSGKPWRFITESGNPGGKARLSLFKLFNTFTVHSGNVWKCADQGASIVRVFLGRDVSDLGLAKAGSVGGVGVGQWFQSGGELYVYSTVDPNTLIVEGGETKQMFNMKCNYAHLGDIISDGGHVNLGAGPINPEFSVDGLMIERYGTPLTEGSSARVPIELENCPGAQVLNMHCDRRGSLAEKFNNSNGDGIRVRSTNMYLMNCSAKDDWHSLLITSPTNAGRACTGTVMERIKTSAPNAEHAHGHDMPGPGDYHDDVIMAWGDFNGFRSKCHMGGRRTQFYSCTYRDKLEDIDPTATNADHAMNLDSIVGGSNWYNYEDIEVFNCLALRNNEATGMVIRTSDADMIDCKVRNCIFWDNALALASSTTFLQYAQMKIQGVVAPAIRQNCEVNRNIMYTSFSADVFDVQGVGKTVDNISAAGVQGISFDLNNYSLPDFLDAGNDDFRLDSTPLYGEDMDTILAKIFKDPDDFDLKTPLGYSIGAYSLDNPGGGVPPLSTRLINLGGKAIDYRGQGGDNWEACDDGWTPEDTHRAHTTTILDTVEQDVYRSRLITSSTTLQRIYTVNNGTYPFLDLGFVEHHETSIGARVFKITVNGVTIEGAFDILANVAKFTPFIVRIPSLVIAGGTLTVLLTYISGVSNPLINSLRLNPPTPSEDRKRIIVN